jgi:hypothetical protein
LPARPPPSGATDMDPKALRRAALVTLRRVIYQRFPPGPVRDQWLAWLAVLTGSRAQRERSTISTTLTEALPWSLD